MQTKNGLTASGWGYCDSIHMSLKNMYNDNTLHENITFIYFLNVVDLMTASWVFVNYNAVSEKYN